MAGAGLVDPEIHRGRHPDIKTIADALKHPELFPNPEDAARAPSTTARRAGAARSSPRSLQGLRGEEAGFNLVDTGSAAGLDGSIAKAYERKEGWVGYYWAPTALLGKYEMVKLEHGAPLDDGRVEALHHERRLRRSEAERLAEGHRADPVAKPFADAAPAEVMDYLNKRSWTNATVNGVMAWMTDNQATGEDGARTSCRKTSALDRVGLAGSRREDQGAL
jgi:glycine betaine/proline transport system substrate-binding protein